MNLKRKGKHNALSPNVKEKLSGIINQNREPTDLHIVLELNT